MTALLAAFQFLLVTPAFIRRGFSDHEFGASVGFYPLVGLVLGVILIGLDWLLAWILPSDVRSAAILTGWIGLTGALHLDGYLDACDGLFGGNTPERRMEIMHDEQRGTFALAGGIIVMLLQYSMLNTMTELRWPALFLSPIIGRWTMSLAVIGFPYARNSGLGYTIKRFTGKRQAFLATTTALVTCGLITLMTKCFGPLLAGAMGALAAAGVIRFTLKRIPGLTGDIYGAVCTLTETASLLAFAAAGYLFL